MRFHIKEAPARVSEIKVCGLIKIAKGACANSGFDDISRNALLVLQAVDIVSNNRAQRYSYLKYDIFSKDLLRNNVAG